MKSFVVRLLSLVVLVSCTSLRSEEPLVKNGYTYISISGFIDGSEQFIFTPGNIRWIHKHWSPPTQMRFSGKNWNLGETPDKWEGLSGLDLSRAYITERAGRDVVALEIIKGGFVLYLSDSPNGADQYSVTIAIPELKKQ